MAACRMSEMFDQHIPVLLTEAINHLVISPQGIYVDATFGRGSHSQAILNRLNEKGQLLAFDKDLDAINYANKHFAHEQRFQIIHSSFAHLQTQLEKKQLLGNVDGILFDLGVSSPQLDNPARGFSFMHEGKLDMRMDTTRGIDAMTFLATIDENELADILWKYGEEKFSRRIARAVVAARQQAPIDTTAKLANVVLQVVPKIKPYDKHPATRTFQAIRIAINEELSELEKGLNQAFNALKIGGRIAVISFHSLEDRIVKQFIKQYEKGEELPRGLPIKGKTFNSRLRTVVKPIKPNSNEVDNNPRARSAILRIAEKLS